MAFFLYNAFNNEGDYVTERIEADSLKQARSLLEEKGYSSITFHYDETMVDSYGGVDGQKSVVNALTPEMELESIKSRGLWSIISFQIEAFAIFWIPIFIWNFISLYKGRPYGILAWIGFSLLAIFFLFFIVVTTPMILYDWIVESYVWRRWTRMRIGIRLFKTTGFRIIKQNENMRWDLDVRLASAMAAEKNIAGVLRLISKYEEGENIEKYIYYGRLADVYHYADMHEDMIFLKQKACECSNSVDMAIDLAFTLVRYLQDVKRASEVLELIEGQEITATAFPFMHFTKGLILLEEKDYEQASVILEQTHQAVQTNLGTPLMKGMLADVRAYWAIALAHTSEKEKARKLFSYAENLLKAQSDHKLLTRCRNVISGY